MNSHNPYPSIESSLDIPPGGSIPTAHESVTVAPADAPPDSDGQAAFGSQLRSAREALGLSLEDAGRKLCLPVRVLRQLEADNLVGIDSPLYLRGYLRSYTRLLGIDLTSVPAAAEDFEVQPVPLETTGGVSHGRYLLQRYAVASTYLVITALIVVPIIVLGLNGGLTRDIARLAPLDMAPIAQSPAESSTPPAANSTGGAVQSANNAERTLMASMTPFSLLDVDSASDEKAIAPDADATRTKAAPVSRDASAHRLRIHLASPSWVEVTDAAGTRLEYALLQAGKFHYSSELALNVLLGDSTGAKVEVDGDSVDLAAYRHGNLASFRVDGENGAVTAPDGA